ncbi:unnamed protein product [Oncorhynchus mykiss]|uniref:C2H2-type domain-containing protein n=1 Tax=Oncorhynchus mykiss TaxID=8022 RepID=A0A060XSR9_ONCMY|nr:unnamed protein product [Oncorhynchus mykiss]
MRLKRTDTDSTSGAPSCCYSCDSERLMAPQVNPLTGAAFSLPSIGSINWNMDPATTQTLPGLHPPHTLLMCNQTSVNASASTLNGNTSPLTNDSSNPHRGQILTLPQCENSFSHHYQLKMHLKVHTGERLFTCMHCGKRFSERSYLRIHQQKMHTAHV